MTPFEQALLEEEKWVCNVIDRPMPTDARAGHRVYMGPTAVDLSALEESQKAKLLREHEQKQLAAWHHHDHRGYQKNRGIRPF